MPQSKNYVVTQERQVKIYANNVFDAAEVARKAFDEPTKLAAVDEVNDGFYGGSTELPEVTDLTVRED